MVPKESWLAFLLEVPTDGWLGFPQGRFLKVSRFGGKCYVSSYSECTTITLRILTKAWCLMGQRNDVVPVMEYVIVYWVSSGVRGERLPGLGSAA